jgi:hypothetical protein
MRQTTLDFYLPTSFVEVESTSFCIQNVVDGFRGVL